MARCCFASGKCTRVSSDGCRYGPHPTRHCFAMPPSPAHRAGEGARRTRHASSDPIYRHSAGPHGTLSRVARCILAALRSGGCRNGSDNLADHRLDRSALGRRRMVWPRALVLASTKQEALPQDSIDLQVRDRASVRPTPFSRQAAKASCSSCRSRSTHQAFESTPLCSQLEIPFEKFSRLYRCRPSRNSRRTERLCL